MKKRKKKSRRKRRETRPAPIGPMARLPLPAKGQKRHGDRTKYERSREKEHLRRELDR